MCKQFRHLIVIAIVAFFAASFSGVAEGSVSYDKKDFYCAGPTTGSFNIFMFNIIEVDPGEDVRITFDLADIATPPAAFGMPFSMPVSMPVFDAPEFGDIETKDWDDHVSYYTTSIFEKTGDHIMDISINPGAAYAKYEVALDLKGGDDYYKGGSEALAGSVVVPEPATLCMLGLGGLGLLRKRKFKS